MKTIVGLWGSNMPKYDDTLEYVGLDPRANTEVYTPQGSVRATGTDFTGSRQGGGLSGAISDDEQRELERKQAAKYVRDFGIQGLDILIGRINKRQAERAIEEEGRAKLQKTAAESMKLTGEALKFAAEAQGGGPIQNQFDLATRIAREKLGGQQPTAQDIDTALGGMAYTRAISGQRAGRDLPNVPGEVHTNRVNLGVAKSILGTVKQSLQDPTLTGQESAVNALMSRAGMETPRTKAFTKLRADLEAALMPVRIYASGKAVTDPEAARTANFLLDKVGSALISKSDLEIRSAVASLDNWITQTLSGLDAEFRMTQPSSPLLQNPGAHPLTGSKPGQYRSSTGRTVNWDGTQETP